MLKFTETPTHGEKSIYSGDTTSETMLERKKEENKKMAGIENKN